MDAVELPLPTAVTVSKLVGSEGFGGVGVTVEEVDSGESGRVSILVSPSIDTCSSFLAQKDEMRLVNAMEPAFRNKMSDVEICRRASQLYNCHDEVAPKDLNIGSTNSSHLLVPRPEAKQSQRKPGKVARSNSGFSKRSRVAQMEVSMNETGADDIKGTSKELGLSPAKCNIAEKTQMAKQKNNLNGKRGDKRNGKVPKSKSDSFSLKAGLVSFNSTAGGNNILGVYCSKPDIYDVTKHVEELSLNDLLDGSFKCPGFAKDKGKKAANLNENILHSVKEACSILQLPKRARPQNFADIDNSYIRKVSTCLVSSGSSVASRNDGDKGDIYTKNLFSCNEVQDSCGRLKTPAYILDFPLHQPKEILERLALPPPKDLEFLLLDAAKPAVSSRNNSDLRLGKPVSHRGGLPPFPWSHTSGGHCKSNSDAVKISTSKSTCQGRWVKIGNPATSLGPTSGFLAELESLTYDDSLVPSGGQKLGPSEIENSPSTSVSLTFSEKVSLSSATCSMASQVPPDELSPRLLAAAETLCDIATQSSKQNPHGMIRWPKKPSQKAMRACKLKSNEKSEKIFATPKSRTASDSLVNGANEMVPSKKLRLSVNEKSDDLSQTNTAWTGLVHWSAPRSSRSSPSKLLKDSMPETKHYNANIVKKSTMMPTSTRVLDKACNSQPKRRKLMPLEWNRAGGKLE